MTKTRVRVAAVALALTGATLTSGFATASALTPTAARGTHVAPTGWGRTLEAVTVRKEPSSRSTALAVLGKGVKVTIYEGAIHGKYKACGKQGNLWLHVAKDGTNIAGWVVRTCLKAPGW
ncbi:SH3 domain-containing protein [Streptomyces endophytica]|uniref:SH3 domain-containing protein n=1 Tax=Streptomyces endophytica TaxID=2991496 RepID=A0ABY6P7S9_9ACTN|nr:SH3 domain-containing protein [Streptomyces endophytica]UZJ29854.1 SH3 domain-containing protein [Streptomyces endophytica]